MLLFLFLSAFLAVAHSHEGCGAAHPGKHEMEVDAILMRSVHHRQDRRRLLGKSCEELCTRCIEVPTYFHFLALPLDGGDFLLPHPTNAYRQVQQEMQRGGQVTVDPNDFTSYEEMLTLVDYQMAILNQRTKDTPFRFTLMDRNETTVSTNPDFVFEAESRSGEISAALSKGDGLSSLNVYLAPSLNGLGDTVNGVTLGFATFPSNQLQQLGDGIFLRYDVMARGGFERRDKGITLVHEVGHWLGLLHVFEDSATLNGMEASDPCVESNTNDLVDDTPTMAGPSQNTFDCLDFTGAFSLLPDTCPNLPGSDPVFNWMNYLQDEACYEDEGEFTCGQMERMYKQWILYREQENEFSIVSSTGTTVFDSEIDHVDLFVLFEQEGLNVAICIPNEEYTFRYTDSAGNGLAAGSIKVLINQNDLCTIEQRFGSEAIVQFNPDGVFQCEPGNFENVGIPASPPVADPMTPPAPAAAPVAPVIPPIQGTPMAPQVPPPNSPVVQQTSSAYIWGCVRLLVVSILL